MGTIDGLLADKDFIVEAMLSLIEEERRRIVACKLIDPDECDQTLTTFIRRASCGNPGKDELIDQLNTLHGALKEVKFQGDQISLPQPQFDHQYAIAQLGDLSFKYGSAGNHKIAYEIDQLIQLIKQDTGE